MFSKITSFALSGLEGVPVEVETDINRGLVAFEIVGLPDAAVKESKERVRSAIKNSALYFPINKITINLAPADIKKEGSHFDLALAVGVLIACGVIKNYSQDTVFLGELALDGGLRPVAGLLPMLISAKSKGYTRFIIPKANANEASYIEGTEVYALENLRDTVDFLTGAKTFAPVTHRDFKAAQKLHSYNYDMSLVKGQKIAKRAVEIAVAGGHNILLAGPPGTGKTLLARCIPTIMPDMTFEEALEVTKIHSVSGELSEEGIITLRPFRTPHHTATTVALCGGGNSKLRAGEISKANKGVLFLDELPEYTRSALESLRQPLEDKVITVARAGGAVTFPADFILCASMNPCPCGNYGSSTLICTCTPAQIHKYRSKISGPLLDRIDLQVEVDGVSYDDLAKDSVEEPSAKIKERVEIARKIQRERFKDDGMTVNANMGEKQIKKYCVLSEKCESILKEAFESLHLSARARSRIIKVARTIADLAGSENILPEHILEAASYRAYEAQLI